MKLFGVTKLAATALIGLVMAGASYGADGHLDESSEVKFCKGISAPYQGCAAAELRRKADQLGNPVAIFEFVRNRYDYALYYGAQSGAINTFLGGRGNDVDIASALISMLRSQGIPARFAVGVAKINLSDVQRWLQVDKSAVDLPMSLMKNQGIQKVEYLDSNKDVLKFEHVWVEALVPYTSYRGAGKQTVDCSVSSPASECHWVSLDASYKKYKFKFGESNTSPLDPFKSLNLELNFPYVAGSTSSFLNNYYNALKDVNSSYRDKNPLEIYQEQILAWMRVNAPGSSLKDIPDYEGVESEFLGILPAKLPYIVEGGVRTYNSVADHDAVVPSNELKKWGVRLGIQIQVGCGNGLCTSEPKYFRMTDLAYQRPSLVVQKSTKNLVLRLGGVDTTILTPSEFSNLTNSGSTSSYSSYTIVLTAEGAPATETTTNFVDAIDCDGSTHKVGAAGPGYTDEITKACYRATHGSYYVIAIGGETSNWSQVHRAASDLLAATQKYKIIFNPSSTNANGPCSATNSGGCSPYVDLNGNGVIDAGEQQLINSPDAMDELTGGVLYAAATQYFAQLRDHIGKLDALNKIKSPIAGFMGLVSSGNSPSYIGDTAYSITPDGLIIDMKGMNVHGCWRIDGSGTSNAHCDFIAHIASALEHETWQSLTGYDAISTVRGIQIALKDTSTTLLNVKKSSTEDTVQSMYGYFGYSDATPQGFVAHDRLIAFPSDWTFIPNRRYDFAHWSYPNGANDTINATYQNYDGTHCFSMIKKLPSSESDSHIGWMWYQNDGWAINIVAIGTQITLYTNQVAYSGLDYVYTSAYTPHWGPRVRAGTTRRDAIKSMYVAMMDLFATKDRGDLPYSFVDYLDKNLPPQNFNRADFVYRGALCSGESNKNQPAQRVQQVRDFLLWQDLAKTRGEVFIPTKRTIGNGFDFSVSVQKIYDRSTGRLLINTLDIANSKGVFAGGGFVPLPSSGVSAGERNDEK